MLASLIAGLAACANNTPRPLPEGITFDAWEKTSTTEQTSLAATATTGAWWLSLGDPVLSEMIATAKRRNLDLRIADHRIQEARAVRRAAGAELWPEVNACAAVSAVRSTRVGARSTCSQLGVDASW